MALFINYHPLDVSPVRDKKSIMLDFSKKGGFEGALN